MPPRTTVRPWGRIPFNFTHGCGSFSVQITAVRQKETARAGRPKNSSFVKGLRAFTQTQRNGLVCGRASRRRVSPGTMTITWEPPPGTDMRKLLLANIPKSQAFGELTASLEMKPNPPLILQMCKPRPGLSHAKARMRTQVFPSVKGAHADQAAACLYTLPLLQLLPFLRHLPTCSNPPLPQGSTALRRREATEAASSSHKGKRGFGVKPGLSNSAG